MINLQTSTEVLKPSLGEIEIWKDITGFDGFYQVSSFGRVKSLERRVKGLRGYRLLTSQIIEQGSNGKYNLVSLCKDGAVKTYLVHRLVCSAFWPNPENKREVNHIDTDKTNNYYRNLEWNTVAQNHNHALRNGLLKGCIEVSATHVESGLVMEFPSIHLAFKILNVNHRQILRSNTTGEVIKGYSFTTKTTQ